MAPRLFLCIYVPCFALSLTLSWTFWVSDFMCFDCGDWVLRNATSYEVELTPLYTDQGGVERVVPGHGLRRSAFRFEPGERRTISLDTGDYPFDRLLVEAEGVPAWTVPRSSWSGVTVEPGGPPASSAELRAARASSAERRGSSLLWKSIVRALYLATPVWLLCLVVAGLWHWGDRGKAPGSRQFRRP